MRTSAPPTTSTGTPESRRPRAAVAAAAASARMPSAISSAMCSAISSAARRRGGRSQVFRARICATSSSSIWLRRCSAIRWRSTCQARRVRDLPRHRRGQGQQPGDLRHLRRHRPGARLAGLLPAAADLPALSRHAVRRAQSLRHLPRAGPRASQQASCRSRSRPGVDTGDRVRLAGRGRSRPQRRPAGRPVCRSPRARARDLRARRRAPELRGAGELCDGGVRRHVERADARWRGAC